VTDERDTPASKPAGKRRVSRRRPESEVDRAGLASVVRDCLAELDRKGVTQAEAARRAQCGVSTLRHMQNGTGTSHYGHSLLTRVATALGLPEDRLVEAFYPPKPHDPALLSDAELTAQQVMIRIDPYLAKIDAIPQMQTSISEMEKGVAGMQNWLESMARDVAKVSSQLKTLVDINHLPPEG
jgi:transcriptional regulator with XRE-family HTH domain